MNDIGESKPSDFSSKMSVDEDIKQSRIELPEINLEKTMPDTNIQVEKKISVETSTADVLQNSSMTNQCELSAKTSGLEEHHAGWESVRRRLGTLVAVKTVMDTQKKQKSRKLVGQKDFLERFSTREYNSFKNPKKSSINATSRRISVIQKTNAGCSFSDKWLQKGSEDTQSIIDLKPKETVIVENCKSSGGEKFSRLLIECSDLKYTFFEPYSYFIYYWLYLVNLAVTYNAWIIFLRIAFVEAQTQFLAVWFILDYIADFIYIMDIIISSRTSFLEDGIYVDDLKRMAKKYMKSYQFVLDVASVLPLDIFYLVVGITPALRLPRMLKYYKNFVSQKTILALSTYPNVQRTIAFLHLMLIMIHWNACSYFIMSKYEGFGVNNWVYPKLDEKTKALGYQYAYCYYWSTLSLTTIGGSSHPETAIECLFMNACYVIGIFIFASIVGQAGNVIQNMDACRIEFENQRDSSMQYMKRHHVPEDMQRRVRLWYDYSYSRGRFQGSDINDMRLLPNKMKTELALHVHLETLRRVTFLQKCQPEFLHDLVLKMKMIIYTPGDYVCRKGEIAREMYVISDGILEVISETGRILKVLQSGDFFGEIGILSLSKGQNRRTADVRAYGYVELFVLAKEDVLNAIKEYPLAQKILARYGRSRLKQDRSRKNGPRTDTTTTESDDDVRSTHPSINGSQCLNTNDARSSPDSRRSSFRRSLCRKGSERKRCLKVKVPIEAEINRSKLLKISDAVVPSSSNMNCAKLSVKNTAVNPISTFMAGAQSPLMSEHKEIQCCSSSVLVNTNAVMTESEDRNESPTCDSFKKVNDDNLKEVDRILEFIEASQRELRDSMKQVFKTKMAKYQKKIIEKIELLEEAARGKKSDADALQEQSMSKEETVSMDFREDPASAQTVPAITDDNKDVALRERGHISSSLPEIYCG